MSNATPRRPASANLRFSSTISPKSPVVASPQKNLTGLPRLVSDLVAEFYNTTQKWNDLLIKGMPIIKQIINFKRDNRKDVTPALNEIMNKLCEFVEQMEQVVANLDRLSHQMENAVKLHQSKDCDTPLFGSFHVEKFSELFRDILEAYRNEFEVKKTVSESIAFMNDINQVIALGALWEYQTKIRSTTKLKMEMLLSETGHRQLF